MPAFLASRPVLPTLVLLAALLIAIPLPAQNSFRQGFDDRFDAWGMGILAPAAGDLPGEATVFPDTFLTVYEAPGGAIIGRLVMGTAESEYLPDLRPILLVTADGGGAVPREWTREVTYEGRALLFFERGDGFVRVSPAGVRPVWVSEAELAACGWTTRPWIDHLTAMPTEFFPLPTTGLNLRETPSGDGEWRTVLDDPRFLIRPTGARDGQWLEVTVKEYPAHPCEGGSDLYVEWTGWVKAVDDRGIPNLWYFTRGC